MINLSVSLERNENDCQGEVLLVRCKIPFDLTDLLSVTAICDNR